MEAFSLWELELMRADGPEAVLDTVKEFLGLWKVDAPELFRDPADVTAFAQGLAPEAAGRTLFSFFAFAAERLARMQLSPRA